MNKTKLRWLLKILLPLIGFMTALTIVLIFIQIVVAIPFNGTDVYVRTFDKCENITITINGTLQIDEGEYIMLNNCSGENNTWNCFCNNNWDFGIMFQPNTINNYSFIFEWEYTETVSQSSGGGSSRKKRREVVIYGDENDTGYTIEDVKQIADRFNESKTEDIGDEDKDVGKEDNVKPENTKPTNTNNDEISKENNTQEPQPEEGDVGTGIKWWQIIILLILIIFFVSLVFVHWVFKDKKTPDDIKKEIENLVEKYKR